MIEKNVKGLKTVGLKMAVAIQIFQLVAELVKDLFLCLCRGGRTGFEPYSELKLLA